MLQLELAAALDMQLLCATTYKLEGDGLEVLLVHDALEEILSRESTLGMEAATMPNLASVVRAGHPLCVGVKTYEWFDAPYNSWYAGVLDSIRGSRYTCLLYTSPSPRD